MLQTEFQEFHIGVMNARDVKQVKNITTSVKSAKQLTKDEIYNLILLGYHLDGFVHEIKYLLRF